VVRVIGLVVLLAGFSTSAVAQEDSDHWRRLGERAVRDAERLKPVTRPAKKVILFVGDGMGVSTVTAARILQGQLDGGPGEENLLSFEKLPFTALSKTYNTNLQTPDSAGTMTAMMTGVKTRAGVISMGPLAPRANCAGSKGRELVTFLELAEQAGWATGIVSTAAVTHATPGATYAHVPERYWEDDGDLTAEAIANGCLDIARQLVEFPRGDGPEVVLGGGRANFLPVGTVDPEYAESRGERRDERNLIEAWQDRYPKGTYVWNLAQFQKIRPRRTERVLGLFEPRMMRYEADRSEDLAGEPSLAEMTKLAIAVLERDPEGFFLMVEGGRIDHGHHAGNAYRALTDTIAFADAVAVAARMTSSKDTLIIVTADHSHTLTISGYARRGNPILGKAGTPGSPLLDAMGLPYTTLSYANGPGYVGASSSQAAGPKRYPHRAGSIESSTGRPDITDVDTTDANYLQEATVPLASETHAGEDVPVYASGPSAHLVRGVIEQNVIFHLMMASVHGFKKGN
jgi:alkaline phosphatase